MPHGNFTWLPMPGSPVWMERVDATTKSWIITVAGQYRLAEKTGAFLDCIAGVRYWSVESTLTLRPTLLPGRKVTNKEDWVDPLVGLKGVAPLENPNFLSAVAWRSADSAPGPTSCGTLMSTLATGGQKPFQPRQGTAPWMSITKKTTPL